MSKLPSPDIPLPDHPVAAYRSELAGRFRTLRFAQALEPGFIAYLRASQFRYLIGCMLGSLAVLVAFAGLDILRYRYVEGTPQAQGFLAGVLVPRWIVICLLAAGTWAVATRRVGRFMVPVVLGLMMLSAIVSFAGINTLSAMGLPHAAGVGLLLVMIVFYPCGLSFYECLSAAAITVVAWLLLGLAMLPPPQQGAHWMQFMVMLLALGVAAMNGYMREHAMREQYLMRHLLDWEAGHDPQTGLANRRTFGERGAAGLEQSRRSGEPLALALIDVDHFKAYNDHYGHQAGDEALRQVARLLGTLARRPLDMAVRMGGEEFAVVAYAEDAQSLGLRLQQFLEALRAQNITHAASPTAPWLTASVGVAVADGDDTLDSLYQRADTLLYRAKATGRSRVEVQAG